MKTYVLGAKTCYWSCLLSLITQQAYKTHPMYYYSQLIGCQAKYSILVSMLINTITKVLGIISDYQIENFWYHPPLLQRPPDNVWPSPKKKKTTCHGFTFQCSGSCVVAGWFIQLPVAIDCEFKF